ncbi:hypothetical protein FIA58_014405 [Flavobacterium jejuense]|uniref:Uncharacterized protein n=1 Tax=Flavobacterium jejuense TaxID=1544455 RepID=A0ABX0IT53_9FLAO|nr:hypothetical protein [Flavobacterium jejuense]NHN26873.1 hypothetical protein [Flavobacterium jejuense]
MITQKEFNEIIENQLKIREDGSIFITDLKSYNQYLNYLKGYAKKDDSLGSFSTNPDNDKQGHSLINIVCKEG